MVKLTEIYDNVQNPLENAEVIEKLVLAYSQSDRHTGMQTILQGFYSKLMYLAGNQDKSRKDSKDKEAFLVDKYNKWINNILNLTDEQLEKLGKQRSEIIRKMQPFLRTFGKIETMDDIEKLKNSPFYNNDVGLELKNEPYWDYILSRNVSAKQEPGIAVKHRLYINCQNQDVWKLCSMFTQKCEDNKLPYCFKTLKDDADRDDTILIYADTDNLASYIDILMDIARDNPDIISRTGKIPLLAGKINEWLGIGDEPPRDAEGNHSYNEVRAIAIDDAIEEVLLSSINSYKGKTIEYNGSSVNFNQLFKYQAAKYIIDNVISAKSKKALSHLGQDNIQAIIEQKLGANLKKGLKKLWDLKDIKTNHDINNLDKIFTLDIDGQSIGINTYDMDAIVKTMAPIMYQIDPNFASNIRVKVQENCKRYKINESFCFQEGTRELFAISDINNAKKNHSKQSSLKTQNLQTQQIQKEDLISEEAVRTTVNPKSEKRMDFINGFIKAYNDSETEYLYNLRSKDEEFNIKRVQDIIETKGLNRMFLFDLEGRLTSTENASKSKVEYSQKQVSAMARLLKASQLLADNIKLNPDGINYLEEFSSIPSIKTILKQMRSDLKDSDSYMFELKETAKANRTNGTLPNFPKTPGEIEASDSSSTRSTSGQGLKQEKGISAEQAKKIEQAKNDARRQEDDAKRKEDEEQIAISNEGFAKQQKKLSKESVRRDIFNSKVTSKEAVQSQEKIALRQERGKLVSLRIRGQLDEDGKRRLEELNNMLNIRNAQQHTSDKVEKKGNGQSR